MIGLGSFGWKKVGLEAARTLISILIVGLVHYLAEPPTELSVLLILILNGVLRGLQVLYTRLETPPSPSPLPPPVPPSSTA